MLAGLCEPSEALEPGYGGRGEDIQQLCSQVSAQFCSLSMQTPKLTRPCQMLQIRDLRFAEDTTQEDPPTKIIVTY